MQGFMQVSADQLVFRIAQHGLGGAVGKTDGAVSVRADDAVAGGVEQAQAVRLGGSQLAGAFLHASFQAVGQMLERVARGVALVNTPQQPHAEPGHAQNAEQSEENVQQGDFAAQRLLHPGHFRQRRTDAEPADHLAFPVSLNRMAGQTTLFGPQDMDQADALLPARIVPAELFLAAVADQFLQGGGFPRVGLIRGPDGPEAHQPPLAGGSLHPAFLHQAEGIGRVDAGDGHAVAQGEIAVFRGQPGIGGRARGHRRVKPAEIGHPGAQGQILADGQTGELDRVVAGLACEQAGKTPAGKGGQDQNAQAEKARAQQDTAAFHLYACLARGSNGHGILTDRGFQTGRIRCGIE